jgi:hypothetical protein
MATVGALVAEMSADSAAFRADLGKAQRALSSSTAKMNRTLLRLDRGFDRMRRSASRSVGGLVRRMTSFRGAIATVAGTGGLGLLTRNALQTADRIAKLSDSIGISTDSLQEYRHAADLSGVATSKLDSGFQAFSKRIGELRQGTGTLNTVLNKMDEELKRDLVSARSTEEALDVLFRGMSQLEAQTDRNALSAAAFGRSVGIDMTNLVRDGEKALKAMRQEARDLGLIIDEDLLRKSEVAVDKLTRLSSIIKTKVNVALAESAEDIGRIADALAESIPAVIEGFKDFGRFIGLIDPTPLEKINEEIDKLQKMLAPVTVAGFEILPERTFGPGAEKLKARLRDRQQIVELMKRQQLGGRSLFSPDRRPVATSEPALGGIGGGAAKKTPAELTAEIVAELEFEQAQLNRSTAEQRLYNEAKSAGVAVNDAFRNSVLPLIQSLEAQEAATLASEEAAAAAAAAQEDLAARAKAVFDETATPLEVFNGRIAELNDLLDRGAIGWLTYERAVAQAQETLDATDESARRAESIGQQVGQTFSDTFVDLASGALTVSDALAQLERQLLSILSNQIFSMPGGINDQIGGGIAGLIGLFGGFSGPTAKVPAAAAGATPMAGQMHLVGEEGPELFVPRSAGTILPNDLIGRAREPARGGDTFNIVLPNATDGAGIARTAPQWFGRIQERQDIQRRRG